MRVDQNSDLDVNSRTVLAIAAPMTFAFITVPLLGLVDTAVVGQFGDAALIGGLAVGAVIFDVVFTTFNFLRTGTTGFVAQAYGRGDRTEQQALFWRAILLAIVIGLVFVPLSPLLRSAGLWVMQPSADVATAANTYMAIRFLATPFTLINYAILGVLLGQNRVMANVVIQTGINALNITLSLFLGLYLGWNIAGVAWATFIAEAIIALAGFCFVYFRFDKGDAPDWRRIMDRSALRALVAVNRDIMIRSFALLLAFFMFTRMGSAFGENTLAANAILLNFFLVASYFLDGLAAASEQMAGRALGAHRRDLFWKVVQYTTGYGFVLSAVAAAVIVLAGASIADLMTTAPGVPEAVAQFLPWAALTPILGVLAFQMDGVYIGATWSVTMRNMMLVSLVAYLALAWVLTPLYGNHGLWIALNAWLFLRGLTLFAVLPQKMKAHFPV